MHPTLNTNRPPVTAPRFGRSAGQDMVLNAAESFLTMPDKADKWILKNAPTKGVATTLQTLTKNILDHDYKKVINLPFLGKVAVSPPMGAMFLLLFGFTLGGRLEHAIKRAVGGDRRELRDIAFRDIPTFTLILYALEPMVAKMSKVLGGLRGIDLMKPETKDLGRLGKLVHEEILGYSELEKAYTITSPNDIKRILGNMRNHKGLEKALKNALTGNAYSVAVKGELRELLMVMKQGMRLVAEKGELTPDIDAHMTAIAEKGFSLVKTMDKRILDAQKAVSATSGVANNAIAKKLTGWMGMQVPQVSKLFATYARNSRLGADAFAIAIVGGLLGFGVTKFNEWYTLREYERLQQGNRPQEPASPQASEANPFANGLNAFNM